MNERNTTIAAHDADATVDRDASSSKNTNPNCLHSTQLRVSVPRSSPPPVIEDDLPTVPAATGAADTTGEDAAMDNDSEAETLISSPVKKREALKKANGIEAERAERPVPESQENEDRRPDTASKPTGEVQQPTKEEILNARVDDALGEAENGVAENLNGNHSDEDESSAVSSVQSFSDSEDPRASSESIEGDSIKVAEAWPRQKADNPRKRKHRELSLGRKQSSMEPPRRRRRASTTANAQDKGDRSSEERSPQSRLRSHRRTASAQVDGVADVAPNGTGRQRRAASHLPIQDIKTSSHTWESDTSSEASHKHAQNRLVRNLNRSVSTPGRAMGRDHKRHVNKYGFTRLAEACESGELDLVKEWRTKDPEQLEQREFAGNTPLQVASLNGYPEIVQYLLDQGCTPHCANTDKDTPLIDAVENGHTDVVRLLLSAGVDPLRQNMKGQQALDVITDQTEDGPEIRALLREAIEQWTQKNAGKESREEEVMGYRPGPAKGLQFLARTYDNLLKLVSNNDRPGVQEFLDARVPVDNEVVAAAAKTGDLYLVNMLLAEMSPKKARSKAERPMLAVIGTSHFEVVKTLTELDQFNPTWRSKANGMTWYELAQHREGPNWRRERTLLHQLYTEAISSNRLSSSPVSKRDSGVRRRRSPARQTESDAEMEDADYPDVSRNRRRLMSRKDMRAASRRRSSSQSSLSSRSSASPKREKSSRSPEDVRLKPQTHRKVGRPRTKSMTSQGPEPQPKRLRSSSMRDKPPVFDSPQGPPGKSRTEDKRSHEEAIEEEPDEDNAQQLQDAVDAKEKIELAAKIKIEEEQRAEASRKEEEETHRRLEEEKVRLEQRAAEERRTRREERMAALPTALQHALSMSESESTSKAVYVSRHFVPIQAVRGAHLEQAPGEPSDAWMLSYQAAGLLTGSAAAQLLDIPLDDSTSSSLFTGMTTLPISDHHKTVLLTNLGSSTLVHNLAVPNDIRPDTIEAEREAAERACQAVHTDRVKFLSLPSLHWIRCADFFAAKATLDPPHLKTIPLELEFSACLDATPFLSSNTETEPKVDPAAHPSLDEPISTAKDVEAPQVERGMTKIAVVLD